MKTKIIAIVVMVASALTTYSQDSSVFNMNPYFSAVIVRNIDTSCLWYQSVLGLKVKNRINEPERGFKIAILESPRLVMELIEDKSALEQKKIIGNKPEGTHVQGFFKIGFKVSSIDVYITHLKMLKISVDRIYTDPSNKRNFLITDPDGNLVQFLNKLKRSVLLI